MAVEAVARYISDMGDHVDRLARFLVLGALLEEVKRRFGGYDLVAHWTQGEFHHDLVLELPEAATSALPGRILVVATKSPRKNK